MTSWWPLPTILAVFVGFAIWGWRSSTYWRRRGILGPTGRPLIGNMLNFVSGRQHYGHIYKKIYDSYPELSWIGIYGICNEPIVLVRGQELCKDVLIRSFAHFEDNAVWIDERRDPIICFNPFLARGELWRKMRAEIVPIFTPNKVKLSFPHIAVACDSLKRYVAMKISEHNCFDAKNLFSKFTVSSVASAAYGVQTHSLDAEGNQGFTQFVEQLFLPNSWSLIETMALLFSPTLGHLINYRYMPKKLQRCLQHIVQSVLEKRLLKELQERSQSKQSDFIQWLIEAKQRAQKPINQHVITGHCSTFLLEGFETSSSLMAFALYELATNFDVQQRVQNEIDAVLLRHGGRMCFESLQEMSYLDACLFETLRLHPPMMALLKRCTKPFQLPPQYSNCSHVHTVARGTVFIIPVQAIHCDAQIYSEPCKFNPEHFRVSENKERLGCAFLGFGEGPRMCPGMRFGLAQVKAGLVTLLANYSVHLVAHKHQRGLEIAPTTFLTTPKYGIWISFQKRF